MATNESQPTAVKSALQTLLDQDPPIIIKPGPGGEGIAADGPFIRMLWSRVISNEFQDPTFETGVNEGGFNFGDRFVYRHRTKTKRVKFIAVFIGKTQVFNVAPNKDDDFTVMVHYDNA